VLARDSAERSPSNHPHREREAALVLGISNHFECIVKRDRLIVNRKPQIVKSQQQKIERGSMERLAGPVGGFTATLAYPLGLGTYTYQKNLTGQLRKRVPATADWHSQRTRNAISGEISNMPTSGTIRRKGAINGSVVLTRNRMAGFA
jgi:hypothetical protein